MNILLTGSLGHIGKPLTEILVRKEHSVTVISSKAERQKEIEALGAKAAIGNMEDIDFLTKAFKGADIVYLMEALVAVSVSLVTVYDMAKAVDKSMVIGAISLAEKLGGKSGHWQRGTK